MLALVIGGRLILLPVLFSVGVGRTLAAHAGLTLAALPIPTGWFGAAFERRQPPRASWLGAAIASCGEALLIGLDAREDTRGATWAGDLLVALATLCGRRGSPRGRPARTVVRRLADHLGGRHHRRRSAGTGVGAAQRGLRRCRCGGLERGPVPGRGLQLLASGAWYWALSCFGIPRMCAMQFLQPLVRLGVAALLLGEPITAPCWARPP